MRASLIIETENSAEVYVYTECEYTFGGDSAAQIHFMVRGVSCTIGLNQDKISIMTVSALRVGIADFKVDKQFNVIALSVPDSKEMLNVGDYEILFDAGNIDMRYDASYVDIAAQCYISAMGNKPTRRIMKLSLRPILSI